MKAWTPLNSTSKWLLFPLTKASLAQTPDQLFTFAQGSSNTIHYLQLHELECAFSDSPLLPPPNPLLHCLLPHRPCTALHQTGGRMDVQAAVWSKRRRKKTKQRPSSRKATLNLLLKAKPWTQIHSVVPAVGASGAGGIKVRIISHLYPWESFSGDKKIGLKHKSTGEWRNHLRVPVN